MRYPRILNGPTQAVEPKGFEEGALPGCSPTSGYTGARALEQQPAESLDDRVVEVRKPVRRVPRAEVLAPAPEHRIELRDDDAKVRMTPGARRQPPHASAHPRHRTL